MANGGRQVGLQEAAELIKGARRLAFFLHVNPDGDSIGSTLAMYHALKAIGKDVTCVGVDTVPRIYRHLPGWDTAFTPWEQVQGSFDLGVFLDCGDKERVGAAMPVVELCQATLNVDHHKTNMAYGDYNYLDFGAGAVGELAYLLLRELGLPIDTGIANCLYASIMTDTGLFKYDSTTAQTHRIAADLIELGVKPYDAAVEFFENESVERLRLLSRALRTLQVDGRLAWLYVDEQMMADTGASEEDTEGIVNYARAIQGVEVGVFFRGAGPGKVKVSWRSRHEVDVGVLAGAMGGGGHARAAGATLDGDMPQAIDRVLAAVRPHL